MEVNAWQEIAIEVLKENPKNPKKPMAKKCREGLQAMMEQFGFSDCLKVAENLDGTYLVLDGTTRLQELRYAGKKTIPCVLIPSCKEGELGWEDARRNFVLGFDRNRKRYDEELVLAELQDLASRGHNIDALAKLSAKPNLEKLLEGINSRPAVTSTTAPQAKPVMASLVLYGNCEVLGEVKELISQVKTSLDNVGKVKKILTQSVTYLNFDDDRFLSCFLFALKKFEDGHEGTKTETDEIKDSERKPRKKGSSGK